MLKMKKNDYYSEKYKPLFHTLRIIHVNETEEGDIEVYKQFGSLTNTEFVGKYDKYNVLELIKYYLVNAIDVLVLQNTVANKKLFQYISNNYKGINAILINNKHKTLSRHFQ